jgi:hypothetical protein
VEKEFQMKTLSKFLILPILVLCCAVLLTACGGKGDTTVSVGFTGLVANGVSGVETTTELTLRVVAEPSFSLDISNITVAGATKQNITASGGDGLFTLTISNITVANGENVTVTISKSGYGFTPASRTVAVYIDERPEHIGTYVGPTLFDNTVIKTIEFRADGTASFWSSNGPPTATPLTYSFVNEFEITINFPGSFVAKGIFSNDFITLDLYDFQVVPELDSILTKQP